MVLIPIFRAEAMLQPQMNKGRGLYRILTESKSSVISRLNTVFLAGMGVKAT